MAGGARLANCSAKRQSICEKNRAEEYREGKTAYHVDRFKLVIEHIKRLRWPSRLSGCICAAVQKTEPGSKQIELDAQHVLRCRFQPCLRIT
jgi:hypothetical protein